MSEQDEIEIIPPQAAAELIAAEIDALKADGWVVVARSDYAARLTRGRINRDVRVDLLGEVSYTEQPLTSVQESGRLAAMLLLLVFFMVLMLLADILGIIG